MSFQDELKRLANVNGLSSVTPLPPAPAQAETPGYQCDRCGHRYSWVANAAMCFCTRLTTPDEQPCGGRLVRVPAAAQIETCETCRFAGDIVKRPDSYMERHCSKFGWHADPVNGRAFTCSAHEPIGNGKPDTGPRCTKCGFVMVEKFTYAPVNASTDRATPTGEFQCFHCVPAAVTPAGETAKPAPVCSRCHGAYWFDTTIDSETWNRVVRAQGISEYLCLSCIVDVFATAGESFTANLWATDKPLTGQSLTFNAVAPDPSAAAPVERNGENAAAGWQKARWHETNVADVHAMIAILQGDMAEGGYYGAGVTKQIADMLARLAAVEADLRATHSLAKQATNGWACYARRKNEHADISRLHAELDALALQQTAREAERK